MRRRGFGTAPLAYRSDRRPLGVEPAARWPRPAALNEAFDIILNGDYLGFGWWMEWRDVDRRFSDPDFGHRYPNPEAATALKVFAQKCRE